VLVNFVCPPPPLISNKSSSTANQQPVSYSENRDLNAKRNLAVNPGESGTPVVPSGVVGDKRISLYELGVLVLLLNWNKGITKLEKWSEPIMV
jgi:hypothetical protein